MTHAEQRAASGLQADAAAASPGATWLFDARKICPKDTRVSTSLRIPMGEGGPAGEFIVSIYPRSVSNRQAAPASRRRNPSASSR